MNHSLGNAFKKICDLKPSNIAIRHLRYSITYKDLDLLSDNLARGILTCNYNTKNIGVIYTRDYELIVVILAIMKAGKVYVPIDPNSPKERINYIINNAKINLIIGKSQYKHLIGKTSFLTAQELLNQSKNSDLSLPKVSAKDNAYIIYTSGTTGNPKGVVILHENVIHLVNAAKQMGIHSTASDCWSMYHSYAFDFSIWEIFMPLMTGGKLCILQKNVIQDVTLLIDYIVKENISFLSLTPSVFKRLLHSPNILKLSNSSLKSIIFGGERFDLSDYSKWKALKFDQSISLINMYGITETTVHTTYHYLNDDDLKDLSLSPIGQPLDHFQIKLLNLDGSLKEVKNGTIGEIYISGDALAKSYFNNTKTTLERFVTLNDNNRYYKSGDIAKRINGKLYYIGRADRQVKFHGYRVELDGIESALLKEKQLENCLVEVINQSKTQIMLCFYQSKKEIDENKLKKHLKVYLPEYMIPNNFIYYQELPITINGKIDKNLLLQHFAKRLLSDDLHSGAANKETSEMASIWESVLGHKNLTLESDFFKIGGYSLLATELTYQVSKKFEKNAKLIDLIENPIFSGYLETILKLPNKQNIDTRKNDKLIPIAPNQKGLFYTCQIRSSSEYNVSFILMLNKHFSCESLSHAIKEIINKQISMRFHIVQHEGALKLKLYDKIDQLPCKHKAFKNLAELQEKAKEWNKHTFELLDHLLCQFVVGNVGHQSYVYLNIHHLIFDGYSLNIFMKSLLSILSGESIDFDDHYINYSYFENEKNHDQSISFWQNYLKGIESIEYKLPEIKASKENHGNIIQSRIDKKLANSIKNYCSNTKISEYNYYLFSYAVLIRKFLALDDFVIGVPYANRDTLALNSIGYYVNTLPVRVKISENDTKLKKLKNLDDLSRKLLAHQGDNLSTILKDTRIKGSNYSFLFAYQRDIASLTKHHNLSCNPIAVPNSQTKFDLAIFIEFKDQIPQITLEFNPNKLSLSYMQIILHEYQNLLRKVMKLGEKANINHFTSKSNQFKGYESIIHGENKKIKYNNVLELFKFQVIKTPSNIALLNHEKSYTYRELDKITNQVAQYFINHYPNEQNIGMYLARSFETVIFIIGVLKAGKTYIPMHKELPKDRIKHICEIANINVLLTNIDHLSVVKHCLFVADIIKDLDKLSDELQVAVRYNDCAYVLFTSGTTGVPKGVMLSHNALINRILWMGKRYQIQVEDRFILKTPYNFDVSFGEIFLPLTSGASLLVSKLDGHKDFKYLIEQINTHKVTHIYFVPTMLDIFLEFLSYQKTNCKSLVSIFCSGEALMQNLVNKTKKILPHVRVINQYGPTEAGEVSDFEANENTFYKIVPIGKPIDNTNFIILDQSLKPTMLGHPGELYIGGMCLADGYLNNEIITKKNFINTKDYGLIYKTSDLVVMDDQGNVNYLSRLDNQVKINGVRIELGDIEHHIQNIKEIQHACVLEKDKTIIAFYKKYNAEKITHDKILNLLKKQFPAYMLPHKIIEIEELRVTNNGKVDKKFLLDHYLIQGELDQLNNHAPKLDLSKYSDIEQKIINAWKEALNLSHNHFAIKDNFLDLGGNSLSIATLVLKINKITKKDILIPDFMKNTSLECLLNLIKKKNSTNIRIQHSNIAKDMDDDFSQLSLKLPNVLKNKLKGKQINTIFITGGMGFLGRNIIKSLLKKRMNLKIICATTDIKKYNELIKNKFFTKEEASKIKALVIDLSKPKLNLNKEVYDKICQQADAIIHAAAYVNHMYGYDKHKQINVYGTFNILAMCQNTKRKRLIFISTSGCNNLFNLQDAHFLFQTHTKKVNQLNGYIQSKLVSEKLIMYASSHLYDVQIIRTGYIGANTDTYDLNVQDNHVSSLISMAMYQKVCPKWEDQFECLPVNYIAKQIIQNCLSSQLKDPIVKLSNAKTIKWIDFFNMIDNKIQILSHKQWYNNILLKSSEKQTPYLYKLIPLYTSKHTKSSFDLSGSFNCNISYQKMAEAYKKAIIRFYSHHE